MLLENWPNQVTSRAYAGNKADPIWTDQWSIIVSHPQIHTHVKVRLSDQSRAVSLLPVYYCIRGSKLKPGHRQKVMKNRDTSKLFFQTILSFVSLNRA